MYASEHEWQVYLEDKVLVFGIPIYANSSRMVKKK